MQRFSIFTKVLGAVHQLPHLLQYGLRPGIDLRPGPAESTDRRSAESRYYRGQG